MAGVNGDAGVVLERGVEGSSRVAVGVAGVVVGVVNFGKRLTGYSVD